MFGEHCFIFVEHFWGHFRTFLMFGTVFFGEHVFNVRFRSPELGFGTFSPLKYVLTSSVPRQAVETGLRRLSRAGGQVTEAEIQVWAIQICHGMEKLIHRDRKVHWGYCKIKPRNYNIAETLAALLNKVGF